MRPFVIATSGQLLDAQTKKLAGELQDLRDKQGAAAHVRDPRASLKAQLGKALCAADAHRYSSWAAECTSVRNIRADVAAWRPPPPPPCCSRRSRRPRRHPRPRQGTVPSTR